MALANAACLLANRSSAASDSRVLVIDWDLEAPGLHRYFRRSASTNEPRSPSGGIEDRSGSDLQLGLVDFFFDFNEHAASERNGGSTPERESVARVLRKIPLKNYIQQSDVPGVSLMTAGRFDDNYVKRINTLEWDVLYDCFPDLYTEFAQLLAELYDYILIDSRTGVTDTAGICTSIMPEQLVLVFTPNRQSLYGIRDLIAMASRYRKQSSDLRPLLMYPLVSRLEPTENTLQQIWRYGSTDKDIPGYQPVLEEALSLAYDLPACSLEQYFNDVLVQHFPSFSFGEEIAARSSQRGECLALTQRYQRLVDWVSRTSPPWKFEETALKIASPGRPNNFEPLPRSPYPGLQAFAEQDSPHYFGYEDTVRRLLQRLRRGPRLLCLLGASGTGKSSLLFAGLLPKLKGGALPSSKFWKILVARDGRELGNIKAQLQADIGPAEDETLGSLMERYLAANQEFTRILLVVDQFEQQSEPPGDASRRSIERDLASILESNVGCSVVLAFRDSFYAEFTKHFPRLTIWLEDGVFNIKPFIEMGDLISIIAEPAHSRGVVFEEGLVQAIASDAANQAGEMEQQITLSTSLPLLQFCLAQLWDEMREGYITHAAYQRTGGLAGSLIRAAEEAISPLSHDELAVARNILTGLVKIADENGPAIYLRVRRPIKAGLVDVSGMERQVIDLLVNKRLLVVFTAEEESFIELAHEAFIRHWPRLHEWIQEDRQFLEWAGRLERRAKDWESHGRDSSQLLRGLALGEARIYKGPQFVRVGALSAEFMAASERFALRSRARWTVFIAGTFAVVAGLGILAKYQAVQAAKAMSEAQSAAGEANRQRVLAVSAASAEKVARGQAEDSAALALSRRAEAEKSAVLASRAQAEAVQAQALALNASSRLDQALKKETAARSVAEAALRREQVNREAINFFQSGEWRQAANRFSESASLSGAAGDVYARAESLENLGATYLAAGNLSDAEGAMSQAVDVRQQLANQNPANTASLVLSQAGLADVLRARGDYAGAMNLYRLAIDLERRKGGTSAEQAALLSRMGDVQRAAGDLAGAESSYTEALTRYERTLGPEHPKSAALINNLALVSLSKGDSVSADVLLRRALALNEKALGTEHPSVIPGLVNLAATSSTMGRLRESVVLLERALSISDKIYGPEYSETLEILNRLSRAYREAGDLDKAELTSKRVLELTRGFNPNTGTIRK
jgi:tetratricopeptide (TPR) repeat protein